MLKYPIFYLRRQDFDKNGCLISKYFKNKLLIVLIQANFCSYCHETIPIFEKLATTYKKSNLFFASIQIDGETPGEEECSEILEKILNNYEGVPDFAIFYDNQPLKIQFKERNYNYLKNIIDYLILKTK